MTSIEFFALIEDVQSRLSSSAPQFKAQDDASAVWSVESVTVSVALDAFGKNADAGITICWGPKGHSECKTFPVDLAQALAGIITASLADG